MGRASVGSYLQRAFSGLENVITMPRNDFATFAASWSQKVLPSWKPSSSASARNHLTRYLIPTFGTMGLGQIKAEHIQGLVSQLVSEGKSRSYTLNIVVTLASVLRAAARWGYKVYKVDYEALAFPAVGEKQKGRVYSHEQVKSILAEAEEPYRTMFALAALTGMRAGEIAALEWTAVDTEACTINVRRSCYRKFITSVKSRAGNRTIPIPPVLAGMLKAHCERTSTTGLVFKGAKEGEPIDMGYVGCYKLAPLLKRLGIPRAGWHAFRHAQATALVSTGASVKVAQAQLGHSNVKTTLELYAHLIEGEHRKAVSRAAEVFLPEAISGD